MSDVLLSAQMRGIEQAAIASGVVAGRDLMENAGRGVVAAIFDEWPDLAHVPQRAAVLCGPGNNGGDGFVIARLLRDWGWQVMVFLYGDADRLPPDARANHDRWLATGAVMTLSLDEVLRAAPFDLWIDAVFGTGLTRRIDGDLAALLEHAGRAPGDLATRAVSVDIASGLCADSGRYLGPRWHPDLTVTFHRAKPGHYLAQGSATPRLRIIDIGLRGGCAGAVTLTEPPAWPEIDKAGAGHKYAHGHALVLSGGAGRTGAARLAARAALRIGAGVVTLGVPGSAQQEVACQITALMLRRVEDAGVLAGVLADARITALCLGPGLGLERARALVPVALGRGVSTVLDADALTAFAGNPQALFAQVHAGCVLTPHRGEFARLFPDLAERLEAMPTRGPAFSKVDATRAAAARAGCVVLFKGPDTVIAAPDGRCAINAACRDRAAPWLATAGSGDVLAGFITGLMARGFAAMRAARIAARLHVDCALACGPGLIAEDLTESLPAVLRAMSP